jgi:hypothetical protein
LEDSEEYLSTLLGKINDLVLSISLYQKENCLEEIKSIINGNDSWLIYSLIKSDHSSLFSEVELISNFVRNFDLLID